MMSRQIGQQLIRSLLILGYFALTLGSSCTAIQRYTAKPTPTSIPVATPEPVYVQTFEALWQVIVDNYIYPDFGGVNPDAIHSEYLVKIQEVTSEEEFIGVVEALLNELPEGAVSYETRAERIETDTRDTSRYEGIGAFVAFRTQPDPHVVLLAIIPNSPAEQAGLQAHDSILAVDGLPVLAEEGLEVIQRIRGPAGSDTILTVRSPDQQIQEVKVTRGQLSATALLQAATVGDTGLAYFLFPPAVYDSMVNEFANGLESASAQGLKGLILDLRIARDGANWPINALLTLFADGEVGEFYTRYETSPVMIEGQDVLSSQSLPIAILVGPDTSGSPEIFAAIMQAIERATIIGLPTPGNIEGLAEFQLPDGSRALILTSSYRTPAGDEIGLTGIAPNIPVEADWDSVTQADDPVIKAAVLWLLEQQ